MSKIHQIKFIKAFVGFLSAFMVIDAVWIGLNALSVYKETIGHIGPHGLRHIRRHTLRHVIELNIIADVDRPCLGRIANGFYSLTAFIC